MNWKNVWQGNTITAMEPNDGRYFCRTYALPITIGNGCWLGGGVIVLPGVTIGEGCMIGAGSVVTKDIPENSLAVGNPCRVIRKINMEKMDYDNCGI